MKFSFVEEDMLVVGIAVGIVIFFCVDKDVGIVIVWKWQLHFFLTDTKLALASHKRTHTEGKTTCTKSTKSESSRC